MIRENQQLFNILNVIFDVNVVLISIFSICSFIIANLNSITGISLTLTYELPYLFFILLIPSYLILFYELKFYF